MEFDLSPAIGIDLGTTFCCAAYLDEDTKNVTIIESKKGERIIPSCVAFTDTEELVGKSARNRILRAPLNVIYDSKRLIGKNILDVDVQKYGWTFNVIADKDNAPLIQVPRNGRIFKYKPEDISALLLKHIRKLAENQLNTEIRDAVITVPAHFNLFQREATKEAAKLAGLNVLKILNEPTAAALAYKYKNEISDTNKHILVFDLGGGTLDVSIVVVNEDSLIVRATCGNNNLGGRDFDNNLGKFIIRELGKNLRSDEMVLKRVNERCEKIKINLTFEKSTYVEFASLLGTEGDVNMEITRAEFEDINMELFEDCMKVVRNCLFDAKLTKKQIDKVVLAGGSTRIPKLQQIMAKFFGAKKLTRAINPDEAVAYGAAIQAAILKDGGNLAGFSNIFDVTPLSIGTDLIGGLMKVVIPRNTPIPTAVSSVYNSVVDRQQIADFNVYEGERSIAKYNLKIGSFVIKLPPKPPGYPVHVVFRIDANGILNIEAKSETGDYINLAVEYGKQTEKSTDDIIQDFIENKESDDKRLEVVRKWRNLQCYCTKMQAICTYDKRSLSDEEKHKVIHSCKFYADWLKDNEIKDGTVEEETQIESMQKVIEGICEPIMNKYGYSTGDMTLGTFYAFITNEIIR